MGSPSTQLATLRPDLSAGFEEFSLEADRMGFIGHRVFPLFPAGSKAGVFGRIPLEQLLQTRDTRRNPGAGYSRGNWTFRDESYACQEHGAEEPVDDNQAAAYRSYFDLEQISANRAKDAVLRNHELRIANKVMNAVTWSGSDLYTGISVPWTNKAGAVPCDNILAAKLKVYANCGFWPNAVVMTRAAFLHLRETDQILARVASSGAGTSVLARRVTIQQIAEAFDVDHVLVAGSVKNVATEGQDASLASLWPNAYVSVCRIAETNDLAEPCIGRVMHWDEDGGDPLGTVESYRDETVRSDIVRVRHDVDEKLLYVEAAHLLGDVIA